MLKITVIPASNEHLTYYLPGMDTLRDIMNRLLSYIEMGAEIAMDYLLTIEGIIVIIILSFLAGFIARIRSI